MFVSNVQTITFVLIVSAHLSLTPPQIPVHAQLTAHSLLTPLQTLIPASSVQLVTVIAVPPLTYVQTVAKDITSFLAKTTVCSVILLIAPDVLWTTYALSVQEVLK